MHASAPTAFSQARREWHFALTANVHHAFPQAQEWLNNFKSRETRIESVILPDTALDPESTTVDVLFALHGEHNPARWEALENASESVQVHFWPLIRSRSLTNAGYRTLTRETTRILQDERDLLSRTALTLLDAVEAFYDGRNSSFKWRHELARWPPYEEFYRGDGFNTIILPLVNYRPHPQLLKVAQNAARQSLELAETERAAFFRGLNRLAHNVREWPQTRLAGFFFPGILPRNFAGLGQRQLYPVQATVEMVMLVQTSPAEPLTENDKKLLAKDLNALAAHLLRAAQQEKETFFPGNQSRNRLSEVELERAWEIMQKYRWARMLAHDQKQKAEMQLQLKRWLRELAVQTEGALDYRSRVRLRELDYLGEPQNFWAVNNLTDIYNKVGNYCGALLIAGTIIDDQLKLRVPIPLESSASGRGRGRHYDQAFATFLENYAFALEHLKFDPERSLLVRKKIHQLRGQ